jgi:hypothetical protein
MELNDKLNGWENTTMELNDNISCLTIPRTIVLDRDTKFTSNLWRGLFKLFGENLNFSIAYRPHSDGKTERVD